MTILTPIADAALAAEQARHAEVDALQTQIVQDTLDEAALQHSLDTANAINDAQVSQIVGLQGQVNVLQSQLAGEINQETADRTQIAALQNQIAALNAQVASLQAQTGNQAPTIARLNAEAVILGGGAMPRVGVFVAGGPGMAIEMPTWINFLGGKVPSITVDFGAGTNNGKTGKWGDVLPAIQASMPTWQAMKAQGMTLCLSIGMLTDDTKGQWAQALAGNFDSYITAAGQALVAGGLTDTIIRLGHEGNGNWYPWSAGGNVASYKALFQRYVGLLRAVPGNAFEIDFCVAGGAQTVDWGTLFPGSAVCDYFGMDVYNTSWNAATQATPQTRWADVSATLLQLCSAARTLHKRVSVPEWATGPIIGVGVVGQVQGGSDSYFIDQMWKVFANPANNIAYHCWWGSSAAFPGDFQHNAVTGPAGLRYKLHWGA